MTTTFSRQADPHRISLFGKVRNSMSSHSQESKANSVLPPDGTPLHDVKVGAGGWVSNAPGRKRRSLWRKTPTIGKAALPDLPPALSLNFDSEKPSEPATDQSTLVDELQSHESLPKAAPAKGTIKRRNGRQSSAAAPTPAAAVALAAASKATPASPEAQVKYHCNARLKVKHATELVQLCSQEIKMRGLATVGIFRPFRMAESIEQQERLVELFLLYVEPKTYEGVFALSEAPSSALFQDTLGRPNAEAEFRKKLSYANIYDVVAFLKWGLRRLTLQPDDLGSVDQYTWYDMFVEKEKAAGYPAQAYSELLLPTMQQDTRSLFDAILELMSTVAAHNVANAMSASRICRALGFWLVGRLGNDHPPHDLSSVIKAWERSNQVMEHLLMAYVRDQATRIHLMPSRLMEIVAEYPHLHLHYKAPCLKPHFGSKPIKALVVDIRSENVVVSTKRPRGPSETLRAALKAQGADLESSEELDDWSAILGVACNGLNGPGATRENLLEDERGAADEARPTAADTRETQDEVDSRKELTLFEEEDARILRIVSAHFERRKVKSEGGQFEDGNGVGQSTFLADLGDSDAGKMRRSHSEGTDGAPSAWGSLPASASYGSSSFRAGSMRGTPSNLGTLLEDKPNVDWSAFSSDGFAADKEAEEVDLRLNEAFKPKSALERAFEEEDRVAMASAMKRQASTGTLRRKKPYRNQFGSVSSSRLHDRPLARPGPQQPPSYTLNKVSSMAFDECFVHFWQDQLLDDCVAARLPYLVIAQLNRATASRMLGSGMGHPVSTGWLLVTEAAIPPRPPLPSSESSNSRRGLGMQRRRNASLSGDYYDDVVSERKSIFAPSIRSTFSISLARTRSGLKRMSSLVSVRNASQRAERSRKQAEIDEEVRELQEAVQSRRSQASSSAMEVLQSSTEDDRPKTANLMAEEGAAARTLGIASRAGTTRTERSSITSRYQDAKES